MKRTVINTDNRPNRIPGATRQRGKQEFDRAIAKVVGMARTKVREIPARSDKEGRKLELQRGTQRVIIDISAPKTLATRRSSFS